MERSWGPELSGVGEGVKEKWGDKGASDEQWIESRDKRDLEREGDAKTRSREGTAMSPSSELAAGTEHELEKVRSLHDQTFHQSNHDDHRDGETEAREGDGEPVTFPDGGLRAWLVVAGAGHILFATFGFVVSFDARRVGREHDLRPARDPSARADHSAHTEERVGYLPRLLQGHDVSGTNC